MSRTLSNFFAAALFVLMLVSIYLVFVYAPIEATMGEVQKIFYFHVASAWTAFLAFAVVFVASIVYLAKQERRWDHVAYASAEIGVVFCSLVLITGPIWAKPVWGIWWTWDARLTSTLMLWLIFVAYLMLRVYVTDPNRRANLAAVFGIIGFVDVPIVYMSIRWWRTQHPSPVIGGGEGSGLDPQMKVAFFTTLAAFTLLYIFLMARRVAMEKAQEEVEYLQKATTS